MKDKMICKTFWEKNELVSVEDAEGNVVYFKKLEAWKLVLPITLLITALVVVFL